MSAEAGESGGSEPFVPGARVGEYLLEEMIAGGDGWSRWRARDTAGGGVWLQVALPGRGAHLDELVAQILDIARGPRVHRLISRIEHAGGRVLVLEALPGESLEAILSRGPLPPMAVWQLADGALAALADVHATGVLHLDVKPRTLWELPDGTIKLLGFLPVRRTDATIAGTPMYMPPEQFEAIARCDERSDLFALGIVLWEAATGNRARRSTSFDEMVREAALQLVPPSGDPVLFPFIGGLVALSPDDRFSSAVTAREQLRVLMLREPASGYANRVCPHCGRTRDPWAGGEKRPWRGTLVDASLVCGGCNAGFAELATCASCGAFADHARYCGACGSSTDASAGKIPMRTLDGPWPAPSRPITIPPSNERTTDVAEAPQVLQTVELPAAVEEPEPLARSPKMTLEPAPPRPPAQPTAAMAAMAAMAPPMIVPLASSPAIAVNDDMVIEEAVPAPSPEPAGNPAELRIDTRPHGSGHDLVALEVLATPRPPLATPVAVAAQQPRTVDHLTNSVFGSVDDVPNTARVLEAEDHDAPSLLGGDGAPRVIGNRYRVVRELGSGGQSTVYLVENERSYLREHLALRVPKRQTADPSELAQRLRTQHKLEKILSDRAPDRVVRLFGVEPLVHDPGFVVGIVTEYMDGGTLWEWIGRRWSGRPRTRADLARLLALLVPVLETIEALHEGKHLSGVPHLHRDIKPSNLLVDAEATVCKLTDFYLACPIGTRDGPTGTPPYMAPECFSADHAVASDVYAIGCTLYQLIAGALPFAGEPPRERVRPPELAERNPIVPHELSELVHRCLDPDPGTRPSTVGEILGEISRLGLTGGTANAAPASLARLLVEHLPAGDLDFLAASVAGAKGAPSDRHAVTALVEEYCYSTPPRQVLAEHCTARQLVELARALDLDPAPTLRREELIDHLLAALGFRRPPSTIPGIDSARRYIDDQLVELANAASTDDALGRIHAGIAALERVVEVLMRFYGQLQHGAGLSPVLRAMHNKAPDRLTLGEKLAALRRFAVDPPQVKLPRRVAETFAWPILPPELLDRISTIIRDRSRLSQGTGVHGVAELARTGGDLLRSALDIVAELAASPRVPVVLQIVSRVEDVYGRCSYTGRDDRDRPERIFTPLPLELGALYLFYGVTNPVRINPLLFPFVPAT